MGRLVLGEVLKPQGIRGELKVKTFTDTPDDVKAFGKVYIDDTPYKILSFRVGPDGAAYMGLRGIPDRNAAELFRGKSWKANVRMRRLWKKGVIISWISLGFRAKQKKVNF